MGLNVLTVEEFQSAIAPIHEEIKRLHELLASEKPKRTLWKRDILKRLGVGNTWWDKNLHRLPLQKSEGGHYYCDEHELEEWLNEGNL